MSQPRYSVSYPGSLGRNHRRALGVYYTPERLADHVARAALAPLLPPLVDRVARAARGRPGQPLRLRILDPAVGDGSFLRAAARAMGERLAPAAGTSPEEAAALVAARCYGIDVDPVAVEMARRDPVCRHARLMVGDALAPCLPGEMPAGGFDAVIGNPPWGGWDRSLDAATRRAYRARFTLARGRLDPFALFIERATALLRDGGRLGLVLPDYFLLKNYPWARRHVLDNYRIEELARWGRAFEGVSLDVCTLVATRGHATPRAVVRCLPEGPAGRVVRIPRQRFVRSPGHLFNLSMDAPAAALLDRLGREGVRLGDWMETHEGIHSGNIRSRLFVPPGGAAGVDRRRRRNDGSLRPLLFGRDEIRPFALRPAGWLVRYDRAIVRRTRGEYANLGRAEWFAPPKILVRRTGDRVIAVTDRSGLLASNNLFVALPRPGCPVPLEYLEGYLNSTLATWCFRAMQPRAGRIFAELKLTHLNRLPVPVPASPAAAARVVRLTGRIRAAVGRGATEPAAAARAELDRLFASLAGLTLRQRALVDRERVTPRVASPL